MWLYIIYTNTHINNNFLNGRRHRSLEAGSSQYKALLESINIEPTKMSLELLNTKNQVFIHMAITTIQDVIILTVHKIKSTA